MSTPSVSANDPSINPLGPRAVSTTPPAPTLPEQTADAQGVFFDSINSVRGPRGPRDPFGTKHRPLRKTSSKVALSNNYTNINTTRTRTSTVYKRLNAQTLHKVRKDIAEKEINELQNERINDPVSVKETPQERIKGGIKKRVKGDIKSDLQERIADDIKNAVKNKVSTDISSTEQAQSSANENELISSQNTQEQSQREEDAFINEIDEQQNARTFEKITDDQISEAQTRHLREEVSKDRTDSRNTSQEALHSPLQREEVLSSTPTSVTAATPNNNTALNMVSDAFGPAEENLLSTSPATMVAQSLQKAVKRLHTLLESKPDTPKSA